MVRLRLKLFWFSKGDSTGRSERKKRRKGRQKKWEDNIKKWTGMNLRAAKTEQDEKGLLRSRL